MGRHCSLALTSMTESRKAQWQCASTTRLECHVRMRGCAELSYRDSRCLLIPVGKPLSCEIREKGRRERKREGGEKKETSLPRVHVCESQMAFAPGYSVYRAQISRAPDDKFILIREACSAARTMLLADLPRDSRDKLLFPI